MHVSEKVCRAVYPTRLKGGARGDGHVRAVEA